MKSNMRVTIFLTILAVVEPSAAAVETASPPAEIALRAWLAPLCMVGEKQPLSLPDDLLQDVARFYRVVGFKPVWVTPNIRSPQEGIDRSAIDGIAGEDLFSNGDHLCQLAREPTHDASIAETIRQVELDSDIEHDVLLTAGMLQFARHLYQGRVVPETLPGGWLACRRVPTRDIPIDLARAVIQGRLAACLDSLQPGAPAYWNLKKAIVRYRAIHNAGGWPAIAPGTTLRIGDSNSRVDTLIDRLSATGDLPAGGVRAPTEYDTAVQAAVKRFQRRHGLAEDGLVGRCTLSELNIPVEARIDRLRLNMERWRWFPDSLGDRYLMVNIPAFELQIVEAGVSIDRMRAIVGKHRR
ncbi:MAG: peptidoglycan-binding protein, partial [Desulfosarcina sp.]